MSTSYDIVDWFKLDAAARRRLQDPAAAHFGRTDWNVPGPGMIPPAPAPTAHWSMTHRDAIITALVHQRDTTQSASAHAAAVDALKAMGVDHE